MGDNALKRPFQIITSVCDTCVTAGSYGLNRVSNTKSLLIKQSVMAVWLRQAVRCACVAV